MLRIVEYGKGHASEPCILLLGYFDGVHAGHRKLIARAKELARTENCTAGIMTFCGQKNGKQIYVFSERAWLFERLGLDFIYSANYDDSFRATKALDFLARVLNDLNVKAFVCGEDFTFGKGAEGKIEDLSRFCDRRGVSLYIEPLVSIGGAKAAATRAKMLLDEGKVAELAKMLGDRYFIRGKVSTEGRHIGRKLGFPTANIHLPPEKYPLKAGVYAISADIDGKVYRGIANYGPRPTFGDAHIVLEVFADGYSGDLYGREITVYFDFWLREIRKFDSAGELSAQLTKDLEKIR